MNPSPLKIRVYGDPCLRKVSSPLKEVGFAERMLIQSMIVTMKDHKGIGLAAPQVGVHQRLLVADVDSNGSIAIINPKIIKEIGWAEMEEGCLSVPGMNIVVERPAKIVVQHLDEDNNPIEQMYEGLLARVILHEIDHLDGKLIPDYATNADKKKHAKVLKELEESCKKT